MTITKADLAERLYEKVGFNNREAKEMVEAFFEEIADCLVRGEEVKLAGLVSSRCAINPSVQDGTRKLAKAWSFRLVGSLHSTPAAASRTPSFQVLRWPLQRREQPEVSSTCFCR